MSSKKSRSFKCRDALWQTFEQMARDLECSMDYLVNDAMKQYARQRGYRPSGNSGGTSLSPSGPADVSGAPPPPPPPVSLGAVPTAAIPAAPPRRAATASPFPPPGGTAPVPPMARAARAAPPPPPVPTTRRPPPPAPGTVSRRAAPPPPAMPHSMPPPPPGGMRPPPPMPGAQTARTGALAIHYQGEVFPISKDRFIIGRGKQSSDLTIKDPNVSRQHAMIEFLNGQYYIVDMGSTNGVEYNGQRVQRRIINEGDIFRVCDHELRFSFV